MRSSVASRDAAREALKGIELQVAELRSEMAALGTDLERMQREVGAAQTRVTELIAHVFCTGDSDAVFGRKRTLELSDQD